MQTKTTHKSDSGLRVEPCPPNTFISPIYRYSWLSDLMLCKAPYFAHLWLYSLTNDEVTSYNTSTSTTAPASMKLCYECLTNWTVSVYNGLHYSFCLTVEFLCKCQHVLSWSSLSREGTTQSPLFIMFIKLTASQRRSS